MIPVYFDIVGICAFYFFLMQAYDVGERLRTTSILYRAVSAVLVFGCAAFSLDYVLNLVMLCVEFYTSANFGTGLKWFSMVLFTGLVYRAYFVFGESLKFFEIMNFAYTAILFGNYFRLRDADTRERIGTHRMKTIYEEVHGKPFTDEVLAVPFDQQMTKFKKVPIEALQKTLHKPPPEYAAELAALKQQKTTDVSVSCRFELFGKRLHPFLGLMERWVIDPVSRELSIDLVFPSGKIIPVQTAAEQARLVERVYESLQVLIGMEWFRLYEPHISFIIVECLQQQFNDLMVEEPAEVMKFRVSLHHLRERSSRITTETEIRRIAAVVFNSPSKK